MSVHDPFGFVSAIGRRGKGYRAIMRHEESGKVLVTHAYSLDTLKNYVIPECEAAGDMLYLIIGDDDLERELLSIIDEVHKCHMAQKGKQQ